MLPAVEQLNRHVCYACKKWDRRVCSLSGIKIVDHAARVDCPLVLFPGQTEKPARRETGVTRPPALPVLHSTFRVGRWALDVRRSTFEFEFNANVERRTSNAQRRIAEGSLTREIQGPTRSISTPPPADPTVR